MCVFVYRRIDKQGDASGHTHVSPPVDLTVVNVVFWVVQLSSSPTSTATTTILLLQLPLHNHCFFHKSCRSVKGMTFTVTNHCEEVVVEEEGEGEDEGSESF